MKRRGKSIVISLAVLILTFMGFRSTVYAEEKINIKMNVGFNDYYKFGYSVPFKFEIENKSKDINGELQVETINEKNNINIYSKEVNLPSNSTKKITMSIPLMKPASFVKVKIVQGKKVVYEHKKTMKTGTNDTNLFTGVLSDEKDNISYLGGIKSISIGSVAAIQNTIELTEKNFPSNSKEMGMFNIIVLNNFDTSKLSKEQYEILKNWVYKGGVLLIGTGTSQSKTLSVFKDDFITGKIGNIKTINTNSLYNIIKMGDKTEKSVSLNSLEMSFKEEKPLIKEGNDSLVVEIRKGEGVVALTSYDLGEAGIGNWNSKDKFIEKLLENCIKDSKLIKTYTPDSQGGGARWNNSFQSALSNIVQLPLPKGSNIIVLLIVYIILIAPIAYLILKKKDRREYMWGLVPIVSFVFVIIIYVSGFTTRINKPVANVMSVINIEKDGHANLKSYASILSPRKTNVKIQPESGMSIAPSITENYDGRSNNQQSDKNRKVDSKVSLGNDNCIEFYDVGVLSNSYIDMDIKQIKLGDINSQISYYDGKYIGKIENNTGIDLEECYVLTKNNYIKLGNIKNKESRAVNSVGNFYSEIYAFADKEFFIPDRYSRQGKKQAPSKNKEEMRRKLQKKDMILGYFEGTNMGIDKPILIGWNNNPVCKGILVNGKLVKKYEKNLVVSNINLVFGRGKSIEYPLGYFKPQYVNNNGGYDDREKIFHGNGVFEINYDIDKEMNIDKILVKYKLDILKGNAEAAKQFIWNFKESKWEEGDFRSLTIDKNNMNKYLSNDKNLKFKLQLLQEGVSGELPQISVKGSVK